MAPLSGIKPDIEDIRQTDVEFSILDDFREKLRPKPGLEKTIPTMLLYDEQGLKLFEQISYLEEYYLTRAEIEVLENHSVDIANSIPPGCQIIELGSGNLRKVKILLDALEAIGKDVDYYALDLSMSELERTLSAVPKDYRYVRCHGLHGTYTDGLKWLKRPENRHLPKWIVSLGSSIGNFTREDAASFLANFAQTIGNGDSMLIGLDGCQDEDRIYEAYNDKHGKTHEFLLNGLLHANYILGKKSFQLKNWLVEGKFNKAAGCHQAFYISVEDCVIDGIFIQAGEKIRVEESYKYSESQANTLWEMSGLERQGIFGNVNNDCHLHLLAKQSRQSLCFPSNPKEYAPRPVPSLAEFRLLWNVWDVVTRKMIPEGEILSRPIKLRNCCLFYLGHIPAFLDIHLTKATGNPPTEPAFYHSIFERGIDPDVDNPKKCHAHSEIPDSWPPVPEILQYQALVRTRTAALYDQDGQHGSAKVSEALWLAFEHEAMHLETLLYMLLQSDRCFPPPVPVPDFEAIAKSAQEMIVPNDWVSIPETRLMNGLDNSKRYSEAEEYFGWDNEKPRRVISVPAFEAKARPITNEEYARYLYETKSMTFPASWALTLDRNDSSARKHTNYQANGDNPHRNNLEAPFIGNFMKGKAVKTVFGPVSLHLAKHWPVVASYDELSRCAKWMGGRIPTMGEARSIYEYVEGMKAEEAEKVLARTISAVNGHLSNDGVEETPPQASPKALSRNEKVPGPDQLFVDLEDCNVGFKRFHPLPVVQKGNRLCGQGDFGGVWEWTSSVLEKYEGFEPMELYPARLLRWKTQHHSGGFMGDSSAYSGKKVIVRALPDTSSYASNICPTVSTGISGSTPLPGQEHD
ncbi:MAG: hypothetical protein Q9167_000563 [Letrouitia subvulpina]